MGPQEVALRLAVRKLQMGTRIGSYEAVLNQDEPLLALAVLELEALEELVHVEEEESLLYTRE